MNTRTKIAASGLLIAALAASATPAFAADTTTGRGAGHSRHAEGSFKRGPLGALVTAGTITQVQADMVETATRTAMQAAQTANFNAALAALVSDNTITQALADAAKASAASSTGKRGHADLSTWTVAQRSALHTWLDANRVDRAAIGTAAVAKLVTSGTITQAQADAINAAFAVAPDKGGRGGKGHGKGDHDGDGPAVGTTVTSTTTA